MMIVFFNYDYRIRYFHATWHLLVMAGTVCHFLFVRFVELHETIVQVVAETCACD